MKRCVLGMAGIVLLCLAGCSRFVILHDPLSASEHNDLGVAYEATGELALAKREYLRALRKEPGHATARVNLANVEWRSGDLRGAERHYRGVLRSIPDHADACNNLAALLVARGGGLEEAEALARRALEASTEGVPLYWETLGEVLERRGKAPEAMAAYQRALEGARAAPDTVLAERLGRRLMHPGSGP